VLLLGSDVTLSVAVHFSELTTTVIRPLVFHEGVEGLVPLFFTVVRLVHFPNPRPLLYKMVLVAVLDSVEAVTDLSTLCLFPYRHLPLFDDFLPWIFPDPVIGGYRVTGLVSWTASAEVCHSLYTPMLE